MVLWVAMLGAVAASRENRHIAIDVLSRDHAARADRRGPQSLCRHLRQAVAFILAWYSWEFVAESREFQDRLLDDLPAWWFQAILPVGFLLIGYRYAIWCVRGVRSLFGALAAGVAKR